MAPDTPPERMLKWRQVRELVGLGRTTAWRQRRAGDFPQPVPISPGRVAWREKDIIAWTTSRGGELPLAPASHPPASTSSASDTPGAPEPPRSPQRPPGPPPVVPRSAPRTKSLLSATGKQPSRTRSAVADGQLGFDF